MLQIHGSIAHLMIQLTLEVHTTMTGLHMHLVTETGHFFYIGADQYKRDFDSQYNKLQNIQKISSITVIQAYQLLSLPQDASHQGL
jgi:hypothetical protein